MINWKNIAAESGLTPDEFRAEVLAEAARSSAKELDKLGYGIDTAMEFTCYDGAGKIEVRIKRVSWE